LENAPKAARIAAGLAISALAGAICAWIGTPLPWMVGSIFGMGAAQMAGMHLATVPGGREAGFVVVGTSLGLYFTAPVVHEVASLWPWFVALGLAALAFGTLSAWILARLSGTDRATAFFGCMPGGAAEMANLGEKYGAAPERVALAHSLRMLMVVTVFPVAITLAGFHATEDYRPVLVAFDARGLAILLAIAAAVGAAAKLARVPTAFMMGALIASTALTVSGVELSSVPTPLTNAAQVFMGAALGARFERDFLVTAPRFVMALVPTIVIMLALAALVGWGLAAGSGTYLGAGLLAAAPGGIAEMCITAKVLRIGVAFVTAAHVIRYAIVVLLTGTVFRLFIHRRTPPGGV
jgi:membrane AbrB-like protein